jgi:hypothetical protein
MFYVAWGLHDVDWKLYKTKAHAVNKVKSQEEKGQYAQIWSAQQLNWADISLGIVNEERRAESENRQTWASEGGPLRRILLQSGPRAVDYVRGRTGIEKTVTLMDAALRRIGLAS